MSKSGESEMVKRVADALAEAEGTDDGMRFERMAKAAIGAMREPTEAMEFSGSHPLMNSLWKSDGKDYWDVEGPFQVWTTMIDEALK